MLSTKRIIELFEAVNEKLKHRGVIGEIGICGGAVMCLVYEARQATKDVDAVFQPTTEIREVACEIAADFNLPSDWLNDAAKAYFHIDPPTEDVLNLSNLRVWAPTADYMLAMKCVSARFDSADRDDLEFLIEYMNLTTAEQVFDIVCQYYPKRLVPAKSQFLVEELMDTSG
ncbi:MAG: hypothetical protein HQ523_16300 [Lentisphaerae bacterium]|nr:hypothetical protein [Lentisphaerota bacterium]